MWSSIKNTRTRSSSGQNMAFKKGLIFDIKEFSVNDGPGVRQTVFLKGCPMRCSWCHNPEGLEQRPQLMVRYGECKHCGKCEAVCRNEKCNACGDCATVCPGRLRSICGTEITSEALAGILKKNADIYSKMGGGVTFSGGEPLMQSEFLLETIGLLSGTNIAVETCGYAGADDFSRVMAAADLVMLDLKIIDQELHEKYCGIDNMPILANLSLLKEGGRPFIVRIPLIPGVTDSDSNIHAAAALLSDARRLLHVELLPYNRLAGAKYGQLGLEYKPGFDTEQPLREVSHIFKEYGIESKLF